MDILHETDPKPAFPCDVIELKVDVADGGSCQGTKVHDIEIIAWEREEPLGRAFTSITVGEPARVSFDWEPNGFSGYRPISQSPIVGDCVEFEVRVSDSGKCAHDLVIRSVEIQPETPRDGDPATVIVEIEDLARFDGVVLKNVSVRVQERYSGFKVGELRDITIISQDKATVEVEIDTGGLAGETELMVIVDPDDLIEELTPEGMDGENNNVFPMRLRILE